MNIKFATILESQLSQLDETIQKAIFDFANHVETHGFKSLKGRNKSSAIESTTKKGMARFKTAQKHCLWHYHIGLPEYVEQANGEFTSEMVLHYMRLNDCVVLVDVATHPPFNLPSDEKLNY
ncbi:hypothetical protein ACGTJS_09815 [Faucicola mancuniensis]|uniref:hypothetical protein n=1 Tax=Faucicola mancuniensis TaxID=1309795 RepID=UPI003977987C